MSVKLGYFVISEKGGQYMVLARCDREEEAEDKAVGDEFDRIHIAEIVQVVG